MSLTYVAVLGGQLDALLSAAGRALPRRPQRAETWSSGPLAVRVFEYDRATWHDALAHDQRRVAAVSGHLFSRTDGAPKLPELATLADTWQRYDGEWSALVADDTGLGALSSACGTEHVYVDRNASYTALSNRCRVLWHLRAASGLPLTPDLEALSRLLHLTYPFCTRRTTVAGIELLPPGELYQLQRDGSVTRRRLALLQPGAVKVAIDWDAHARAARRRMTAVCESVAPVRLAITGGKDSRLVAAMLDAAGCTARARACLRAPREHSDFLVGAEVASTLGIAYERFEPDARLDLAASIDRHLQYSEGMLSAWDMKDAAGQPTEVGVHGLLGEVYRRKGSATPSSPHELARALIQRRSSGRVVPGDVESEHVRSVRSWIDDLLLEGTPLADVPDLFYLQQRVSRWVGQAKLHDGLWGAHVNPVFSLPLLRDYYSLSLADRHEERVHYELTVRLSPRLAAMPFANARFAPAMIARSTKPDARVASDAVRSSNRQEHLLWRKAALQHSLPWVRTQLQAAEGLLKEIVQPARVRALSAAAAHVAGRATPADLLQLARAPRLAATVMSNPTHPVMDVFALLTAVGAVQELEKLRTAPLDE